MIATPPDRPRRAEQRRSHRQTKSRDTFYDSSSSHDDDAHIHLSFESTVGPMDDVSIRSGMVPNLELNRVPADECSARIRKDSSKETSSKTQSETAGSCNRPNSVARNPSKSTSFFDVANFPSMHSMFFTEKSEESQAHESPQAEEPKKGETNHSVHERSFGSVASWLQSVFLDSFNQHSNGVVDDISEVSLTSYNGTTKDDPGDDNFHVGAVPLVIAFPSEFKPKAPTTGEIVLFGIPLNLSLGWNVPLITGGEKGSAASATSHTLLDYGRALIRPAVNQINEMLNLKIRSKDKITKSNIDTWEHPGTKQKQDRDACEQVDDNEAPNTSNTDSPLQQQQDNNNRTRRNSSKEKKRSRRAHFEREGSSQSIASGISRQRGRPMDEKRSRRSSCNQRSSHKSLASKKSLQNYADNSDGTSGDESTKRNRRRSMGRRTRDSKRADFKRRESCQSLVSTRSRQSLVSTRSRQSLVSTTSRRSEFQHRRSSSSHFSPVNKRQSYRRKSFASRRKSSTRSSALNTPSRRRFSHQRQQSSRSLVSIRSKSSPLVPRKDDDFENSPRRFTRSSSRRSISSVGSYLDDVTEAAHKQPREDYGRRTSGDARRRSTLSRRGSRAGTNHRRYGLVRQQSVQSCLM